MSYYRVARPTPPNIQRNVENAGANKGGRRIARKCWNFNKLSRVQQRAGGDGGMTVLFHAARPRPAAPQHERSAAEATGLTA